jgi:hypothetical protein
VVDHGIEKNYIESKGITVKQVLKDSLIKLDAGKYTCLGKKYKSLVESET